MSKNYCLTILALIYVFGINFSWLCADEPNITLKKFMVLYIKVFSLPAVKGDMQHRLDNAMQEVTDKYLLLEESEKSSVRLALTEERGRFCHFVTCLKPFVVR